MMHTGPGHWIRGHNDNRSGLFLKLTSKCLLSDSQDCELEWCFNWLFPWKLFPDSSQYKKYNGSCFMYLSEIFKQTTAV